MRLARAGRYVRREVAVVERHHVNGLPLEALGGVDRGKHQIVLVEVRRAGEVRARDRRIEHQLGDEVAEIRGLAGRRHELVEVLETERAVRVVQRGSAARAPAFRRSARTPARGSSRPSRSASITASRAARASSGSSSRACGQRGERGRRSVVDQHVEHAPRASPADAVEQLEHAEPARSRRRGCRPAAAARSGP